MQNGLAAEHGDLGRSGLQHGASARGATAQAKTAVARPRGAGGAHAQGRDGWQLPSHPRVSGEKSISAESDGRGREAG